MKLKLTKLKIAFAAFLFTFITHLNAQTYVTIPDPNFVTYLQDNYPGCMSGNQMNIDCPEIQEEDNVGLSGLGISDLTGIEYFINLNQLYCSFNQLSNLPVLPNSLTTLNCQSNQLTSLPNLPATLSLLLCYDNQLTSLPNLPGTLTSLSCGKNQLTSLPILPATLVALSCSDNQLTSLPILPNSLRSLQCLSNQLTSLPNLPISITEIYCSQNLLSNLPNLPDSLSVLYCQNNQLTSLPDLPANLIILNCSDNQLTSLPNLPNSFIHLYCSDNSLTSLPNLPNAIRKLFCNNNNITCFPVFPDSILWINISSNPFTCLRNYIPAMDAQILAFPLCAENDLITNLNGCAQSSGLIGNLFWDQDSDCVLSTGDEPKQNIPFKLYNQTDSLLKQTFSAINGIYQFFLEDPGTYTVKIDTADIPFIIPCNGGDTTLQLLSSELLLPDVNFPLECKPGFDIGTQSVVTNGWIFPGQNHEVKILAGDMSQWYNMACASGISGEVQVSVSGLATYHSSVGNLIPNVNGNTFTYSVTDFGAIDFRSAFSLIFQTNTAAQAGDSICIHVSVTPSGGDNNPGNNEYDFCYQVINSYDPNMKEVYPGNVQPGYDDYFTYTIHFQNTGNAPAFNIRLADTLDSNLDFETFQVINYSHLNTAKVAGNVLTFHFPNIMLPDSTSNPEGSKGYVQYRIKPKANLPLGTEIKNTAYIYFDFNAPVVTNTTTNSFLYGVGLNEMQEKALRAYPNPFSSQACMELDKNAGNIEMKVYNLFGQEVGMDYTINGNKLIIDRSDQPAGIYVVKLLESDRECRTLRLIVKD